MAENTLPNSDASEVTPLSETTASESIAERRTIVYKTLVDVSVVKLIAEKFKSRVFVRFGLLKPKPKEVLCVSIEKFYEPFLAVDARYLLDYHRKREVSFEVDSDVQEVIIGGQNFKPQLKNEKPLAREVKVPIFERIISKRKVYILFDKFGDEIDPERVPHAPSEENPERVLEEYKEKVEKLEMPSDAELEIVRSRIVEKPVGMGKTVWQSFEVSDRVIIYVPYYNVAFKNIKTGEAKSIKIDGVTGNIVSQ